MIKIPLRIFFICLLVTACTPKVKFGNTGESGLLVIEANISTAPNQSRVILSRTVDGLANAAPPPVSGAQVSIKDNTNGTEFTLSEKVKESGIYTADNVCGKLAHQYTLTVRVGDVQYTAVSTMPSRMVPLISLRQVSNVRSFRDRNNSDLVRYFVSVLPVYQDPADETNFYQYVAFRNHKLDPDVDVSTDDGKNGLTNVVPITVQANVGDSVHIDLQCVDARVYQYLFGLSQAIQQANASPSNPITNINGERVLGYFKAHTSSVLGMQIKAQ